LGTGSTKCRSQILELNTLLIFKNANVIAPTFRSTNCFVHMQLWLAGTKLKIPTICSTYILQFLYIRRHTSTSLSLSVLRTYHLQQGFYLQSLRSSVGGLRRSVFAKEIGTGSLCTALYTMAHTLSYFRDRSRYSCSYIDFRLTGAQAQEIKFSNTNSGGDVRGLIVSAGACTHSQHPSVYARKPYAYAGLRLRMRPCERLCT
jgi:hypothetical protein